MLTEAHEIKEQHTLTRRYEGGRTKREISTRKNNSFYQKRSRLLRRSWTACKERDQIEAKQDYGCKNASIYFDALPHHSHRPRQMPMENSPSKCKRRFVLAAHAENYLGNQETTIGYLGGLGSRTKSTMLSNDNLLTGRCHSVVTLSPIANNDPPQPMRLRRC